MTVFIIFPKLETRFNTHTIKTRKNKRKAFLTPNQNSFAFIICKNHRESRLETLILRQKCDDKRTRSLFNLTSGSTNFFLNELESL